VNEITVGSVVKTNTGTVGRIIRSVAINGVVFHRLQRVIVCPSGRVIETRQLAFVADAEIVAFRAVAAQPVAVWQGARSTAQLLADARAAFETAIAPVEAEYAPKTAREVLDTWKPTVDVTVQPGGSVSVHVNKGLLASFFEALAAEEAR
jgi:hypothetical protein